MTPAKHEKIKESQEQKEGKKVNEDQDTRI